MDIGSLGRSGMKRKQSNPLLSALGKGHANRPSVLPQTPQSTSLSGSASDSPSTSTHIAHTRHDDLNPDPSLSPTDLTSPRSASSTLFQFGAYSSNNRNFSVGSVGGGGGMSTAPSVTGASSSAGAGRSGNGVLVRRPEDVYRTVRDRLFSWSYMMHWYQGDIHWFNTVKIPRTAVEASLGPAKVDQRARSFFLLGASLSPLFDIVSLPDFLKALLKLLDEWEGTETSSRQGVKNLFRGQRPGKRPTAGLISDISVGTSDAESLLLHIHLPFSPDFFQVHASTCSIVRDIYKKILGMILPAAPSTSPPSLPTIPRLFAAAPTSDTDALFHPSTFIRSASTDPSSNGSQQHAQSQNPLSPTSSSSHEDHRPLGALSPPSDPIGISSSSRVSATQDDAFQALVAGDLPPDKILVGEGQKLTAQVVELFIKVDAKLKKHFSNLLREGDNLARKILDDEINLLASSLTSGAPLKFDYRAAMSGGLNDWGGGSDGWGSAVPAGRGDPSWGTGSLSSLGGSSLSGSGATRASRQGQF